MKEVFKKIVEQKTINFTYVGVWGVPYSITIFEKPIL
jgi:hypothetical protein